MPEAVQGEIIICDVDSEGRVLARYTQTQWQQKKMLDKLDAIEKRLTAIEDKIDDVRNNGI